MIKREGEHLVMLATKFELREVRKNPNQVLFVLVCKDILISPNDITSLPSVSSLLQDYEDVFPKVTLAGLLLTVTIDPFSPSTIVQKLSI